MISQNLEKILPEDISGILERHWKTAFLGILLVSGLIIRLYLADKIPLWNDEAITANVARSLSENNIPALPSGKEYWRALPFTFLVSISERLFGHSDIATRLPSIILSTGTILLTYVGGKNFFNKKTGIVAASVITFLPWQLSWDIQVRMYAMLQFLYLAAIILIYRLGENNRALESVFLVGAISLGMATHQTAYILPVIAIIYLVSVWRNSLNVKKFSMLFVAILAALIVQFLEDSYITLINTELVFNPENFDYYIDWLVENNGFLTGSGLIGAILGFRDNFKEVYLLVLSIVPPFIVYSFLLDYQNTRYLHFMVPFLSILAGYLVTELIAYVESISNISDERFFIVVISILLVFSVSSFDYSFDNSVYRPYFDHESVYDHISKHDSDEDILITMWTSSATYYYRAPDYSLQGGDGIDIMEKYSYKGKNVYSGAEYIFNASKLEDVIVESSGWLVMRETGFLRKPKATRYVINSGMKEVGDFERMRVWRWNNTGVGKTQGEEGMNE